MTVLIDIGIIAGIQVFLSHEHGEHEHGHKHLNVNVPFDDYVENFQSESTQQEKTFEIVQFGNKLNWV